ncbi:mechanosensitive ion channel family protein [Haloarchaeobius sp. TZWWS8]|uniref:mechanosensitive ion channel family protein n=1 Tax=Haloarchaeobius sp. TZWWS8 TaxID=3446121 RepID=UPI003EB9208A
MKRRLGYAILLVSLLAFVVVGFVDPLWTALGFEAGDPTKQLVVKGLLSVSLIGGTYGLYLVLSRGIERVVRDKRHRHDVRNVTRLCLTVAATVAVAGVVSGEWMGVLFSLGIVGFAVTFALQQPLSSLLGWVYITAKRPYQVGDRVRIEDARGDVIDVDFLVTTLWEIDGDLVTSHQPSGRVVTVPNSMVLSSQVFNYSRDEFPFVWNELEVQVSYETDLDFAKETMREVADEFLGDVMQRRINTYRRQLDATPVELEVQERPTVNVRMEQTWVVLRLRYLVEPTKMQATRNQLYDRIVERFHAEPEKVAYPVGRFR